ncbi:syntaxin-1B-like protein [Turdus rufiventris]|nr:syntaxin-1B-like protein [Turdus rufiventris]
MRDRLAELQQRAAAEGNPHDDSARFDNPAFVGDDGSAVGRALREAAELWRALERLEQLSESIDRTQQSVLCCTSEQSMARHKSGLGAARAAFARQAAALQPQLGALPAAPAGGSGRAGPRRLKEQIQRQAELAGIPLAAQDVDVLAESPQGPRIVGRELEELKAKQQLGLAQARQRQLLELEAQMLELRGLLVQLEGLLAQQHGAADSVEQHVLRTLDYAAHAGGGVKRARKYQRPSRCSALLAAALGLCSCCPCLPCPGPGLR